MTGNVVTWLGHSCVVVRLDGQVVATDPVLRGRVVHLRRAEPVDSAALAGLTAVLVSHIHHDHLDLPSLGRLDRSVTVVVPRGAGRLVRGRGFDDVREVEQGDELQLGAIRIRATHAEHGTVRRIGLARAAALGYVVDGSVSVYFAGDTDLFPGMAALGPVDVALLPVAGWGSRLPAGHLDPAGAAEAARRIDTAVAIPIHWGTYAPWRRRSDDAPARAFAAAVARVAPAVEARVLQPGESWPIWPRSSRSDDFAAR
jgi:L-ascorbate metabolism protein UlaG (beta-lactamase superfamily)